jgi:hypothetical protein
MSVAAEYLIETGDRCVRLAKTGRRLADELNVLAGAEQNEQYTRMAETGRDVADELDAIGQDLMVKAVELDAQRQKSSPGSFGP